MPSNVQLVRKSANAKTGPIPTTTSPRSTCPPACPLAGAGGCYAEAGYHTRMNWDKVDSGERGAPWAEFLASVASLPAGQLWRHNVAGDLQGASNKLDVVALREITQANQGRRGFTYTHYPLTARNRAAIEAANRDGFTVNASANTISEAAAIRAKYPTIPVVCILPGDAPRKITHGGATVVTCPATYRDDITCATCKLCSVANRETVVGFPVHGPRAKAAELIATDRS